MGEVMGKRVEQFDDGLVVVAIGWGEQETQNETGQADHTMEFATKILHGLTAADTIVGSAAKIARLFAPFVANAGDRSRVNGCRLFQLQGFQHHL
jgi:hypothetical protein